MKKNVWVFGASLVLTMMAACQNADSEEQTSEDSHENHDHHDHDHSEAVQTATIEGLNDHYHTGDQVELSVTTGEETEGHWHWYQTVSYTHLTLPTILLV